MQVGLTEIILFSLDGLICAMLFSLIIVFIARIKKELAGAFYHCLLAVLISDFMFSAVHMTLFMKFPRYGLFVDFYKSNPWLGNGAYAGTSLYTITQYLGQTLIAFNRFTALWMPFFHTKIWKSKWYIIVICLLPISIIAYRFPAPGKYDFTPDGNVQIGYADKDFEKSVLYVLNWVYGINIAISATLNFLSIAKYFKIWNTIAIIHTKANLQLLVYSIILFGIQLTRFTYGYLRAIFVYNTTVLAILELILQYIVEIHALIAGVAIMILSHETRGCYVKFYFWWFKNCFTSCKSKIYSENTTVTRIIPA